MQIFAVFQRHITLRCFFLDRNTPVFFAARQKIGLFAVIMVTPMAAAMAAANATATAATTAVAVAMATASDSCIEGI